MKQLYMLIILIVVILLGVTISLKASIKVEDTQMQIITKIDPATKEKIEFRLKLYTLKNLHELVPLVDKCEDSASSADKYIFCAVKNHSKRTISIKFKIVSPNAAIGSWSPEISMRWFSASDVGTGSQQYALVWLGSPSLGIPDSEVKLDVEILELLRK